MPVAFLSWASCDDTIVDQLISRLKDLGLQPDAPPELPSLWEYRDQMAVGDRIPNRVLDAIHNASVAILCLSDKAVQDHPWIPTEVAWCYGDLQDPNRPLKDVMLVRVGTFDLATVNHLFPRGQTFIADFAEGWKEDELVKLSRDILGRFGTLSPKLLSIAVLGMTEIQSEALFDGWDTLEPERRQALWDLCRSVGMQDPPELLNLLRTRYGPRPEDVRPFDSTQIRPFDSTLTLMAILHASIRRANVARVRVGKRPILPRWLHGELFGPNNQARDSARRLWRENDSLLVVDAISAFHPAIEVLVGLVPAPADPTRAAVVWLPPYSQHTAAPGGLESSTERAAREVIGISDLYEDWKEVDSNRPIAFETGTLVGLRLWLHRTLAGLPDQAAALASRVQEMPASTMRGLPFKLG